MEKCWTQNPHDRPTFKDIFDLLMSRRAAPTRRRRSSRATVVERRTPVRGLHSPLRVRRETRPNPPVELVNNSGYSLGNRGPPPVYEEGDSGAEP